MKVSVVIPAFNEIRTLPIVLDELARLKKLDLEVVIADDGSTDGTTQWLKNGRPSYPFALKVVHLKTNSGKGAAVAAGFKASGGDVIIIQDADLEYDPTYIPKLVEEMRKGRDVVYGSRLLAPESVTYSTLYLWGNEFLTWVINMCCGSKMTDSYTGYKAFRRKVVDELDLTSRGFEMEAELSVKVAMRRYSYSEIPVIYHARSREEGKKINGWDAVKGIWTIFKTRFFPGTARSSASSPPPRAGAVLP